MESQQEFWSVWCFLLVATLQIHVGALSGCLYFAVLSSSPRTENNRTKSPYCYVRCFPWRPDCEILTSNFVTHKIRWKQWNCSCEADMEADTLPHLTCLWLGSASKRWKAGLDIHLLSTNALFFFLSPTGLPDCHFLRRLENTKPETSVQWTPTFWLGLWETALGKQHYCCYYYVIINTNNTIAIEVIPTRLSHSCTRTLALTFPSGLFSFI